VIKLDKQEYHPGEYLKVYITTKSYSRLKRIIVSYEMGERTHSTSSSDDGTDNHYETKFISYREYIFDPQEIQISTTFKIPDSCIKLFSVDQEIYTFNRIHIKYDISLGRDKHEYRKIPIFAPITLPEPSAYMTREDIEVMLASTILYPNLKTPLKWKLADNINFRNIRVKLRIEGMSKAKGVTDTIRREYKLATLAALEGEVLLNIPHSKIPTYHGINLQINYYVKVTVDIPFRRDINVKIPVKYFV